MKVSPLSQSPDAEGMKGSHLRHFVILGWGKYSADAGQREVFWGFLHGEVNSRAKGVNARIFP